MVQLYLDIDGVLLTKDQKLPEGVYELLDYILATFDCYWLTTHCKGHADTTIVYLSKFYSREYLEKLKQVKPTNWDTLKTEAIDYTQSFVWLDDFPFESEKNSLAKKGVLDRLIIVNLKQSFALQNLLIQLKSLVNA
ncbi:hypothetical protein QNI16_18060 [Cytophagaceae bacterium YF14B1]|uniref:Uncharacterized protein n=1 Tax=Xanthocytophaga flava TaxID=3048013 RepID=A0AAE3QNN5_9BACT|nr:hypothetical protein [Xanthocytophaga flavus]MDJ1482415.1 hypothetical protein [Xanthocytophaga flavus]